MRLGNSIEGGLTGTGPATRPLRFPGSRAWVCLAAAAVTGAALIGAAQNPNQNNPPVPLPRHPLILAEANREPDANDQMLMHEQQAKQKNYAAANRERKKQIADDSAKLLQLAAELNAEMGKAAQDTPTLTEMIRVGEIERLAHDVKEKMKLTVGAN